MAKLFVCSVKDGAIGAFARPIFVPSVGLAMRSFADEVNRAAPENPMYAHPDDFELWVLSEFDEEEGKFIGIPQRCLSRAKDVKNTEE